MSRTCKLALTGLALAFTSNTALAVSSVQIDTDISSGPIQGSGLKSVDSGLRTVPHGTFQARAASDDSTGTMRVFASASQTQPALPPNNWAPPKDSIANADILGNVVVTGAAGTSADLIFGLDFSGIRSGSNPGTLLYGQIIATTFDGTRSWSTALQFQRGGSFFDAQSTSGRTEGSVFLPFPEAENTAVVETLSNVAGRLLMPMSVPVGETLRLHYTFQAVSGAIPGPGPTYAGTFDGVMDGFGSAHAFLVVPTGYALQGENGLFSATPTFTSVPTFPVPEPETFALMLAGLALVGFAARRRKQLV